MRRIIPLILAVVATIAAQRAVAEFTVDTPPAAIATTIERTWHAVIDAAYAPAPGMIPVVTVYRERLGLDADGNVVTRKASSDPFVRTAIDVAPVTYTLQDGTKITGAQILEALTLAFDQAAQEDEAQGNFHGLQ